jgi:regulator of sigma E protease
LYNLLAFADVLKGLGGIVLAVVILLVMVTVHEFGHYVAGKILNFKINEFSVGFGPALWKKRSKKTGELFAVRLVPLGGYCAFDGEDEIADAKSEREKDQSNAELQPFVEIVPPTTETTQKVEQAETTATEEEYPEPKGVRFNDQAPWKRIIVLVAGATMNYLLALLLIIVTFATLGQPMYKIAEPREGKTMAAEYETGDIIERIDGHKLYMITDYMDAISGKKSGDSVTVTVIRGETRVNLSITLQEDADFVNMSDTSTLLGALGLDGIYTTTVRHGALEVVGRSFAYSWRIGGMVLRSLGELLTGKIGLDSMGGPVTTITVTAQAASSGMLQFLNIAALIGVNLAVFNLLPVPALDGSKVVFCLIEWIRKKPINRNVEAIIHFIGIIALFGFAILVDILQLF